MEEARERVRATCAIADRDQRVGGGKEVNVRLARAALVASALFCAAATAATPVATPNVIRAAGFDIQVIGDLHGFQLTSATHKLADNLEVLDLTLRSAQPAVPPQFSLKWSIPSHDVAGHWMTSQGQTKTLRPDWSGKRLQTSMLAREAPVSTLFSSDDRNVLTFAISDALNTIALGSGVREEDGLVYNDVVFFSERHQPLSEYTAQLRIDRRPVRYEQALRDVGEWWAAMPAHTPAPTPEPARLPVYSTWYNYHQNLDAETLLQDLAVAKPLGYRTIIVDDGWQTLDSSRGYAFTGDWQPERIPDMQRFVARCHELGMKVMLWYAVPFVGKNAHAAARFKDKSLRFDERLGAYVLDPRYPEVRQYLADIYVRALRDWQIDGFKLDFIERFVADENTVLGATGGRDYASVNEATDRLMTDIMSTLQRIRPDVMIEFRQPYIGPLIRKYGNLFRASDSPNAYLTNRVKTIDLRLLSGHTAVHADMLMWHESEPVEIAAFQLLNVLFSVPQLSVRIRSIPPDHLAMAKFYTAYWLANRDVLLDSPLEASAPLANYPMVSARNREKQIVALYADMMARVTDPPRQIDIVNAKHSRDVVLAADRDAGTFSFEVRDCLGRSVAKGTIRLGPTPREIDVPVSGLISLTRR
jgi:alpha-galactosidase